MSFIKNMLNGGPKKPDPVQQVRIQVAKDNLEKEKAKEGQEGQLKKTDEKMDKVNHEINQLETEVKALIQQKRKDKATIVLKKLKGKKEVLIRLQKQSNFLNKQAGLLEDTEQDMEMLNAMRDANKVNSKNRDKQEELTDELMKAKEMHQLADQRRNEICCMCDCDDDEDDLDDMMKDYEAQANQEMELNFDKANKNLITDKQQQPPHKQSAAKEYDFDSIMVELMNKSQWRLIN